MTGKFAFHLFWALMLVAVLWLALSQKGTGSAMLAQVESERSMISFPDPAKIISIHVRPGQEVEKGDTLLIVERTDLKAKLAEKELEIRKIRTRSEGINREFESRQRRLRMERAFAGDRLNARMRLAEMEASRSSESADQLAAALGVSASGTDSLQVLEMEQIRREIVENEKLYHQERTQLMELWENEVALQRDAEALVRHELDHLNSESLALVRKAAYRATVGEVYASVGDLVPPFSRVISLYRKEAPVVKVFVSEDDALRLSTGMTLFLEPRNRDILSEGTVLDIGPKVTSFRERISPEIGQKTYGREVYIELRNPLRFLDGEQILIRLNRPDV